MQIAEYLEKYQPIIYKTFVNAKSEEKLSHAYLIVHPDPEAVSEIVKVFAKIIACESIEPCGNCRTCSLIEKGIHPDVIFLPKGKDKDAVVSEDVAFIVEDSYIQPIEGNKKIFAITHGETMNASGQNKLLKTLEEPPENVFIIIGATSGYPILPTVKSRTEKIEIPAFSETELFLALKKECPEEDRLKSAIALGDGTVKRAKELYFGGDVNSALGFAADVICDLKTSREILDFSQRFAAEKIKIGDFLSALETVFSDLLYRESGKPELMKNKDVAERLKSAEGFNLGAILYCLDKISEAQKRLKSNQDSMIFEWLLFSILEGKYKWRK